MNPIDLLRDPVFSTDVEALSLPGLMACLAGVADIEYGGLQAHQAHLWHAFLVQLAAIALARAGRSEPWTIEDEWREGLEALTDDASAWWLEQPDPSRPAFLQPPSPDGFGAYQTVYETPDALDVLATAKNHDLKRARVSSPRAEHWVFALVSLQTSAGFGGAGNYGVSRMNGGYASRPVVAYYRDGRWPARFREDLGRVLRRLDDVEGPFDPDGRALLWLEPWDGASQLQLDALHPLFIEVCRRVRRIDGVLRGTTTKAERIRAKELKGSVADPWIPLKETGEALNVSQSGFHYELVVDVLEGVALRMPRGMQLERDHRKLVMEVLAGQQGGTAGFHRREVDLPEKAASWFVDDAPNAGERARRQVTLAADVRKRCLLPALSKVYGESKSGGAHRKFLDRFSAEVDDVFFPALWAGLELDAARARDVWVGRLAGIARRVLEEAIATAPSRSSRLYRPRAEAWGMLEGSLRKNIGLQEAT
ncbi:MAG: type I-E CRISPR-associated protein Cse1/CasA [Alphaproteobacteria bacterium]|nr:type I-E CRISPR-associated protein Cse1/CasA [Alphaproteobacteria bacterium]